MPIATKPIPQLTEKDKLRFWAKVNKNGPTQPHMDSRCWEWTGSLRKDGYGTYGGGKRRATAHRIAHLSTNGGADSLLHVCHECDNPKCVNPSHLFSGTSSENMQDMLRKNRQKYAHGDNHWTRRNPENIKRGERRKSKLCVDSVLKIKASNKKNQDLADDFNVSRAAIRKIRAGKLWGHVK